MLIKKHGNIKYFFSCLQTEIRQYKVVQLNGTRTDN